MTALRVAILGTASSGKSTLAAALAARYRSVWVPEYLREFVDTQGRVPVAEDQFHIASTQVAREEAALAERHRYDVTLVCAPDIPWVADGLQRESEDVSRIVNRLLFEELEARAIPYLLVSGEADARIAQVGQLLRAP